MDHILLIDGKNSFYRALFAAKGRDRAGYSTHPMTMWMMMFGKWLRKFKPSSVGIFWDCDRQVVWRKKLLAEYKDNRDGTRIDDHKDELSAVIEAAKDFYPLMGVRQFERKNQECDDLIFSACKLLSPGKSDKIKIIIVSSDGDFIQIPWIMHYVECYDPKKDKIVEMPSSNPILTKSLKGDKSDNIDGYRGIGDVKGSRLSASFADLSMFITENGYDRLRRNMSLIDMSFNPASVNNEIYLIKKLSMGVKFDPVAFRGMIKEHKILGLDEEMSKCSGYLSKLS